MTDGGVGELIDCLILFDLSILWLDRPVDLFRLLLIQK